MFYSGSIVDPVRARCAYPGMFLPVEIDGRCLVDGMLSHPALARPLRDMGAERVIAVQLKGQWSKTTAPRHLFDVIGQSFAIAQDMTTPVWRSAADVVIEPDVAGFDYDDFKRTGELIRVGEVAMRRALPEVRKLLGKQSTGACQWHADLLLFLFGNWPFASPASPSAAPYSWPQSHATADS